MSLAPATRAAWRYRGTPRVVTAPTGAVVPLARLRAHVAQPLEDDDAMLQALEQAAQAWVEAYLGRAVLLQTREVAYDGDPGRVVWLPEPVVALTSVTVYDEADAASVVAGTVYALDTTGAALPRLVLRDGQLWPSSLRDHSTVVVRYTAGWATWRDVPAAVAQAVQLLVAHWYEQRSAAAPGSTGPLSYGVESLLMPYRVRTGVA